LRLEQQPRRRYADELNLFGQGATQNKQFRGL
jgi:hypothetical protein